MSAAIWDEPPTGGPRLTIRVSRDSGRTWGPRHLVIPGDRLPEWESSAWPPCECPKHRQTATEDR